MEESREREQEIPETVVGDEERGGTQESLPVASEPSAETLSQTGAAKVGADELVGGLTEEKKTSVSEAAGVAAETVSETTAAAPAEAVSPSEKALSETTTPTVVEGPVTVGGPAFISEKKIREGKMEVTPKGEVRYMATGRRKEAVARVWLIPGGAGEIIVNDRPITEYLGRTTLNERVTEPLRLANALGSFRVWATAKGGGLSGQADALRLGIARALVVWNEDLRPRFHDLGLLTRDPRAKERKKYGRKRARRGFQFRKR